MIELIITAQRSKSVRRLIMFSGLALLVAGLLVPSWTVIAQDVPRTYRDGAFSFDYPRGWALNERSSGRISVGTPGAYYAAESGEMEDDEGLVLIVSPAMIKDIIALQTVPPETPEAILQTFADLSGNTEHGEIESFTFKGLPAARSSTVISSLKFTSYVISLDGGYFAGFDLVTALRSHVRFEPVALAIAATMRYADPLLHTLDGHVRYNDVLAFSPAGTELIAVGIDGLYWWDIATGAKQRELAPPEELGIMRDIGFTADGTLLVVGDDNEYLRIWDVTNNVILDQFAHPPESVFTAYSPFSPDVQQVASVTWASPEFGTLTVWDLATGEQVYQVDVPSIIEEPLIYGDYSPTGSLIGTSGRTYPVYVHDAATGEIVREIGNPLIEAGVLSFTAFSPDELLLAVGSTYTDDTVFVWDTLTGDLLTTLKSDEAEGVGVVVFSPDGRLLASGDAEHTVRVWDVATWTELTPLMGHEESIQGLVFSPDGTLLASGDRSGVIKVWDLKTALPDHEFD